MSHNLYILHATRIKHMTETTVFQPSETKVFKDMNILTQGFIPTEFKHREAQIKEINYYLSTFVKHSIFTNSLFIYGTSGTGKTHIIKKILDEMDKQRSDLNIYYAKSYKTDTMHGFFREFLESSFKLNLHPRDNISEYFKEFEKEIGKSNLIIIDDLQFLISRDPKGLNKLLHYLSRISNKLGLVLIGNIEPSRFSSTIEPATLSSLRLRTIYFPRYNAPQLKDIITDRIKMGALYPNTIPDGVIAKSSALVAQEWGSARYALDLLIEIGRMVENNGRAVATMEDVDKAYEKTEISKLSDQLGILPQQPFAVLDAIYRLKGSKVTEIFTGDVFAEYCKICQESGMKQLSQRRMSDIISDLDQDGLINAQTLSKGRYGRTRKVMWILDRKIYEYFRKAKLML